MAKGCSKFLPAKMDKRVAIQTRTQTTDSQGGFTETWATDETVWAMIEPLGGWERMQAQQMQNPVTHKVTMRYRTGVTTAKRLLYGSRAFDIKEVINKDEANAFLVLKCQEMA